jgi:hypothetical protein
LEEVDLMIIECVLRREAPIIVPMGNEIYHFEPDANGRRVAEVYIESHVECFLAVSHLYREAKPLPEEEDEPAPRSPSRKPRSRAKGKLLTSSAISPIR